MRIMILPSTDGQDFCLAIASREGHDENEIRKSVEAAINDGKRQGGDGWRFEQHIRPRLEQIPGVIVPSDVYHGPTWDE